MENLTANQKEKFHDLLKSLRNDLHPYLEDRNLEFTNKQLFSFVLNLPFIIGIYADEKQSQKESSLKNTFESAFLVSPEDLPDFFDEIDQPSRVISDKEYNEKIINEKINIIQAFEKYDNLFLKALKSYCEKTNYVESYELVNKINRATPLHLNEDKLHQSPQWKYIDKIGINIKPFDKKDLEISDDEWTKIYHIPYCVFYLVSGADENISKKEIKAFVNFIEDDLNHFNPIISHIFKQNQSIFDAEVAKHQPGKQEEILEKLKIGYEVLKDKLPYFDRAELGRLMLKLAYDLAKSAGFWGISFVAFQESKQIGEIAKAMEVNTIGGQKIIFGNKIKIKGKDVKPDWIYKMLYTEQLMKAIAIEFA
jgi:hypothetical protein